MGDTNYVVAIVKVLETPKKKIVRTNKTNSFAEFRVQFPQSRGNKIVKVVIWGKLASEVSDFYQANDYIIIEGYLSIVNKQSLKKVEITAFKVFPFVVNY